MLAIHAAENPQCSCLWHFWWTGLSISETDELLDFHHNNSMNWIKMMQKNKTELQRGTTCWWGDEETGRNSKTSLCKMTLYSSSKNEDVHPWGMWATRAEDPGAHSCLKWALSLTAQLKSRKMWLPFLLRLQAQNLASPARICGTNLPHACANSPGCC